VITNLHLLDRPSQRMLNAWIRDPENSDTQIISLTSERLLPLVDEGSFDRDLFYRLNTIHLELTAA
jgi:DNA-binding NtrC family response regulator